jgi:hypothetical protein
VNSTEQRRQATVAQRLEQTSESVAVLLDALDARLFDQASKAQETRREVNTLREELHRLLKDGVYDFLTDQNIPLTALVAQAREMGALGKRISDVSAHLDHLTFKFEGFQTVWDEQTLTFWGRLRWLLTGS